MDQVDVPCGTLFKPNPYEFWWGWQKFKDGAVAGLQLCRFFEGKPCSRNELDDLEENQWQEDRDPWSENYRIVMQDEAGELVTFSTNSYGGKLAWEELLESYRSDIEHPDLWPVVAAQVGYYDTRDLISAFPLTLTSLAWDEPWADLGSPASGGDSPSRLKARRLPSRKPPGSPSLKTSWTTKSRSSRTIKSGGGVTATRPGNTFNDTGLMPGRLPKMQDIDLETIARGVHGRVEFDPDGGQPWFVPRPQGAASTTIR